MVLSEANNQRRDAVCNVCEIKNSVELCLLLIIFLTLRLWISTEYRCDLISFFQDVVSRGSETPDDGEASAARRCGSDSASRRHHHQPVPSFSWGLQRALQGKPDAVQLRLQRRAASEASEPQTDGARETLTHRDTAHTRLFYTCLFQLQCWAGEREVRGCSFISELFHIKQRHYADHADEVCI